MATTPNEEIRIQKPRKGLKKEVEKLAKENIRTIAAQAEWLIEKGLEAVRNTKAK